MRPIYLSFPDEATWMKLPATAYEQLSPVVIGHLEGVKGFHVNMLGELPEELAQYEVFPTTPACVYAGWSPEEMSAVPNG